MVFKMTVEISNSSLKFLNKIEVKTKEKIIGKIQTLYDSINDYGVIPYKTLDIKSLKRKWYPHKRLRLGNYRIIFLYDLINDKLIIQDIDTRGDIY